MSYKSDECVKLMKLRAFLPSQGRQSASRSWPRPWSPSPSALTKIVQLRYRNRRAGRHVTSTRRDRNRAWSCGLPCRPHRFCCGMSCTARRTARWTKTMNTRTKNNLKTTAMIKHLIIIMLMNDCGGFVLNLELEVRHVRVPRDEHAQIGLDRARQPPVHFSLRPIISKNIHNTRQSVNSKTSNWK